jgi:coproporphyrinogen III oxidase
VPYTSPVGGEDTEFRTRVAEVMRGIQERICSALQEVEREAGGAAKFAADSWDRPGGGGGTARVMTDGRVFEKGGVNVSVVFGELAEDFARSLPGEGREFFATGVSLVMHPRNPHVPTVHANFRYLEHGSARWFGGGADLTPYYLDEDDKQHFHAVWREHCEAHPDLADYPKFRDWCDRYFFLPHRGERRGVGGIFFDYMHVDPAVPGHDERALAFVREGGDRFVQAYVPIVRRHHERAYGEGERSWQLLRRGRYVEFNLLHDRGTVFGLKTGGRTESILMSLPPLARWGYAEEPAPDSAEAHLLAEVRRPPPPE